MSEDANMENLAETLRIVGKPASFTYLGGPLDGEKIPPGAWVDGDVLLSTPEGKYVVGMRDLRAGAHWTPT